MPNTKVLIVDDEPDVIRALEFRLVNGGYEVLTASNGAEALRVLGDTAVDLVLADFMMPEINGLELTRLVKSNPKWVATKVVLFSCNTEPEFRQRAIALGALDYILKTDGAPSIVSRVGELLGSEPASGSNETSSDTDHSRQDDALRDQLRSLSQSLIDMLHVAELSKDLPAQVSYALGSANRIAGDIRNLTDAASGESGESGEAGEAAHAGESGGSENTNMVSSLSAEEH